MAPSLISSINTAETDQSRSGPEHVDFVRQVQIWFDQARTLGPLFTTDAAELFPAYLDALPREQRQHHTCQCCRRFLETYGGLVRIDADGRQYPAFWAYENAGVPSLYREASRQLFGLVKSANVTGVFLSKEATWGTPVTGPWTHLAVTRPKGEAFCSLVRSAGQAMAEKLEDFRTVATALELFRPEVVAEALRLLESDALYRAEKVIGPARWLKDLHDARNATKNQKHRHNLLWRAVALAPAGFCHPRSTMVGTLLEDIAAGMDFAEVSKRFAAKMRPDVYQRPQAAPGAGNIAQAEELVAKLGIRPSLERRFARLEEVETIWKPTPEPPAVEPAAKREGVFAHLRPIQETGETTQTHLILPAPTMTWEKFARTVLPGAKGIEFFVPGAPNNYLALVTAVNADAPPILQWDSLERRNPVSSYVYLHGSPPHQWGLAAGSFREVIGIALDPAHWGPGPSRFAHHAEALIFLLDQCRDKNGDKCGVALFPEILRSELHSVLATIEAYSRTARLQGLDEASACGLALHKGRPWSVRFRVNSGTDRREYVLDRWD